MTILSALLLIETVSEYAPDDILTHIQVLGGFLSSHLSSADTNVQVACAKSTGACIVALEEDGAREAFKPAIQPIIAVLGSTLTRGDEHDASAIMEYLVAIANSQPIFFKGNVDAVVEAMLTVAQSKDLEFPTRSIALELMVTLTETAPALARRCRGLVQGLVPLAFSIMQDLEEEEDEWVAGKYAEEAEDENVFVGEEAVERAAAGMGGRVLAPPVLEQVTQFATSAQSADRRAAVAGLCRLAEGSPASFKSYFEQSLSFLTGAMQDSSSRVRYEAVQCVGRFATLFPHEFWCSFVPGLTTMLASLYLR